MAPSRTEPCLDQSFSTMPTWLWGMYTVVSQAATRRTTSASSASAAAKAKGESQYVPGACAQRRTDANGVMGVNLPEENPAQGRALRRAGTGVPFQIGPG